MIILRQNNYAAQDYAGVSSAWQAKKIALNRKITAFNTRLNHRQNQRWLNRQNKQIDKIGGLTDAEKAQVKSNVMGTYIQKNENKRFNSSNNALQMTTKNNPISQLSKSNTPTIQSPQAVQQGMSFGKKAAIGVGIAAAGYGAYKLLQNRKNKKEQEENKERY